MPTEKQHGWMQRVFGIKRDLGDDAETDDDDVAGTVASTVKNAAATYVDFSVGEVQGAAKVIVPLAEQASALEENLNPAQAVYNAGNVAYKLGSDEQYRDAALAKAESIGETVLGAAQVAAQAGQIATDLMVNPVQGVQEVASVAVAGAEKLDQAYDKVSAGYQDAAAKGEGAQYVGNIVGEVGATVGLAVAGAPEAAGEGLAVEGLDATAETGGLAAGEELPAVVGDTAGDDAALSNQPASADTAPADDSGEPPADDTGFDSGGPTEPSDDEKTVTDGVAQDPAADSGEAVADDSSGDKPDVATGDGPTTSLDGAPADDAKTVTDGVAQDPGTDSGEAVADDDAGGKTQQGAPATSGDVVSDGEPDVATGDGPTTSLDGAPADDAKTVTDGPAQDPGADSGEAIADDDAGDKTQEGLPVDDATTMMEGPPPDLDALVEGASDKVEAMTDEDLTKLTRDEQNQLVTDLTAGGEPSGAAQEALRKVYRSVDLDPTFRAKDASRIKDIGNALKNDEEFKAAGANWAALGPEERVSALKKVVDAQSKAYGIAPPEIETFSEGMKNGIIKSGTFDPNTGKIRLNIDKKSAMNKFENAVDLVAHENAHNYQQQLIQRLQSGELMPGDDEYEQATTFAANSRKGAYIQPDSNADMQDYLMQPMEQHSFRTGAAIRNRIFD